MFLSYSSYKRKKGTTERWLLPSSTTMSRGDVYAYSCGMKGLDGITMHHSYSLYPLRNEIFDTGDCLFTGNLAREEFINDAGCWR